MSWPGYTLRREQEAVEITSIGHHELDPSWRHVDPAGHVHTSLETLLWVVTRTYYCEDCRDEHEEGEYRCLECGAVVEPKYRWVDGLTARRFVPGLASASLETDDGRVWRLRPDEMAVPFADKRPTQEWLDAVMAREPDEWRIVSHG